MNIYIPTYGRVDKQRSFRALPPELQAKVIFVCRANEVDLIANKYPTCLGVLEQDGTGVAAARQTAVEYEDGFDELFFLDDDLNIDRRVSDWELGTNAKARVCTHEDIREAFEWVRDTFRPYPVVGFSARGNNNTNKNRYEAENTRIMRSFGVRRSTLRESGLRFDDFYYWEDFHVALGLLELGHPNVISTEFMTGSATNAGGGVHRDVRRMWEEVARFTELHPHARCVEKSFAQGSKEEQAVLYPDLHIQWKKAFRSKL